MRVGSSGSMVQRGLVSPPSRRRLRTAMPGKTDLPLAFSSSEGPEIAAYLSTSSLVLRISFLSSSHRSSHPSNILSRGSRLSWPITHSITSFRSYLSNLWLHQRTRSLTFYRSPWSLSSMHLMSAMIKIVSEVHWHSHQHIPTKFPTQSTRNYYEQGRRSHSEETWLASCPFGYTSYILARFWCSDWHSQIPRIFFYYYLCGESSAYERCPFHSLSKMFLMPLFRSVSGSFIFAVTIIKFIKDGDGFPDEKVQLALDMDEGLDSLYTQVLSAAPQNENFQKVIGTVMLLSSPLPITALAELLQLPGARDIVQTLLGSPIHPHDYR